jgi:hypothetical protein
MDTPISTQRNSSCFDSTLHLLLGHDKEHGVRVMVFTSPGHADVSLREVLLSQSLQVKDPEDDLANATWEDAEWR